MFEHKNDLHDTANDGFGKPHSLSRRKLLKALAAGTVGGAISPFLFREAFAANANVGPGGIPISTPDHPVTLPLYGEVPIKSGLKPESGTFTIFNYAGYVSKQILDKFAAKYDVKVQVSTFVNMNQALTKLATHSVIADVSNLRISALDRAVAGKLLQPINRSYIPNFKNIWSILQNPYYDMHSQYTVPYNVYSTGIGWRKDKVKIDVGALENPWSIFWEAHKYKGFTGILNSDREALAMAMLYRGQTDINTENPHLITKAGKDLEALTSICSPKLQINTSQTLPAGQTWLDQCWSGDLLTAVFFYLPNPKTASLLRYWQAPKGKAPVENDLWVIPVASTKPVLAHLWMNFILDESNAYNNFVTFTGYQPALTALTADRLIGSGKVPDTLRNVFLTENDFGPGSLAYHTLSIKGQQLWQNAFSKFVSGA